MIDFFNVYNLFIDSRYKFFWLGVLSSFSYFLLFFIYFIFRSLKKLSIVSNLFEDYPFWEKITLSLKILWGKTFGLEPTLSLNFKEGKGFGDKLRFSLSKEELIKLNYHLFYLVVLIN